MRCTLTNYVSSPFFEKAGVSHENPATYNFDPNRKVCKVEAVYDSDDYFGSLGFFDKANVELFSYNPNNWRGRQ